MRIPYTESVASFPPRDEVLYPRLDIVLSLAARNLLSKYPARVFVDRRHVDAMTARGHLYDQLHVILQQSQRYKTAVRDAGMLLHRHLAVEARLTKNLYSLPKDIVEGCGRVIFETHGNLLLLRILELFRAYQANSCE